MSSKILIRSGIIPFKSPDYDDLIKANILGTNIGNLLYATSVYKTLSVNKKNVFETIYMPFTFDKKYVDRINATCKYFVLPCADAFRDGWRQEMELFTDLIKQLKIPCYIIGIGVRAPYEPEKDFHYAIDDTIRKFISAVLDKSASVGVRGQITADYLSRLGFKQGQDVDVIGCPSMYLYGDNLKIKDTRIDLNSTVSYNFNIAKPELSAYLYNEANKFKKSYLIPQQSRELRYMYDGKKFKVDVPNEMLKKMYLDENCIFFNNAKSWLDFMENIDFTFGTRLHGCIASLLKSNSILLIAHDARERELVEFHKFPSIPEKDFDLEKDLLSQLESVDFQSPMKVHQKNFDNYVKFLEKNNIENVWTYKDRKLVEAFDNTFNKVAKRKPLSSYNLISSKELKKRKKRIRYYKLNKIFSIRKFNSEIIIYILGIKITLSEKSKKYYSVLLKKRKNS